MFNDDLRERRNACTNRVLIDRVRQALLEEGKSADLLTSTVIAIVKDSEAASVDEITDLEILAVVTGLGVAA